MTKIHTVTAYIGSNQISEGFYTLDGDTITMVHPDGKRVLLLDAPVTAKVMPENTQAVAKVLTKQIRKSLRGERVEGFSRVIEYPHDGVV